MTHDEMIKVTIRWTEVVTLESDVELDAARLRRLGYDPASPASVRQFLDEADELEGDDWWDWSYEVDAATARRINADDAEISGVTIRR